MIVGQINGGLGNQMFQYAFYKYLQVIKSSDLFLDTTCYVKNQQHNGYELAHIFNIFEAEASINQLKALKIRFPLSYRIQNKFFGRILLARRTHFKENFFRIDRKIYDNSRKDIFVEGFFQTDKYIEYLSEQGFSPFQFNETPGLHEKQICSSSSVSIHVRGGDYLKSKKSKNLYGGICDQSYYSKAVEKICSQVSRPKYFLFTNDIEYARKILPKIDYTLVNWNNGDKSFRDMYLMTLCKHNIVANSSFSWWGAYLNDNKDKTVIAPHKWLNSNNYHQKDIVPRSWCRV